MKLVLKSLVLATATMSLVPAAFADEVGSSGTVHITGQVEQNACVVDDDSKEKQVVLDDTFTDLLVAAGNTTGEKAFTINLKDCSYTVAQHVQLRFEGAIDPRVTDGTVLQNVEGDAHDVGIQILDASQDGNDTPMVFTRAGSNWSQPTDIPNTEDAKVAIPFKARYYVIAAGENAEISGAVDSVATFYLRYN